MTKPKITHVQLAARERQIAKIRSAQLNVTVSAYLAGLLAEDAERAGIASLLDPTQAGKEASDA